MVWPFLATSRKGREMTFRIFYAIMIATAIVYTATHIRSIKDIRKLFSIKGMFDYDE